MIQSCQRWYKTTKRKLTHAPWFIKMLGWLLSRIIRLYLNTLTISIEYATPPPPGQPYLLAGWHGRQFLLLHLGQQLKGAILVDMSWIGNLLSEVLRHFDQMPIRGSSKRHGARALLTLIKTQQTLIDCYFIAADGPRGPIYQAKPGIAYLAKKLALPITPITTSAQKAWFFKSTWCHYMLPKPFTQCLIKLGNPIDLSSNNDGNQLTQALTQIQQQADSALQN